jgi:AraC family cel operon transcriptional repressor
MNTFKQPIYPERGDRTEHVSLYETVSPWKNSDIAFNWINFDYTAFHTHTYWELAFLVEGELNHYINGKTLSMKKHDAVIIRPDDYHCMIFAKSHRESDPRQMINFVLKSDFFANYLNIFNRNLYDELLEKDEPLVFELDDILMTYLVNKCLVIQTLENENIDYNIFQCKILFSMLFNEFLKQNYKFFTDYPEWLEKLLKKLSNPKTTFDSVTELVKGTSYSYSYLTRLFKSYTKKTIMEYITDVKINYAKELLENSDMTTLHIASELGYTSLSHLNHLFRKHLNQTPIEYRKSMRATAAKPPGK